MTDRTKTAALGAVAYQAMPLSSLIVDTEMMVRLRRLSSHHVNDLVACIRRGDKLPPPLVWREQIDGKVTGRLIVLDGRHRIAALRKAKPKLTELRCELFDGGKPDALLAAAGRNSKMSLPLTRREAVNVAWAVVRMDAAPYRLSKATIARECAVSQGTIAKMRVVWKEWPKGEDDVPPSGNWQRDKHGNTQIPDDWDSEEAIRKRQERVTEVSAALRKAVGRLPETDFDLFRDALEDALGWRLIYLKDSLMTPEDDDPCTGLRGDPEAVPAPF